MYPNPMDYILNILTNGPVSIEVHDISGKLVIRVKENQTHKGLNQLDVSLLPSGVYNFSVTYNGNTSTTKVLKR
jgi:nitrate reductase NapAB chaperone NapD